MHYGLIFINNIVLVVQMYHKSIHFWHKLMIFAMFEYYSLHMVLLYSIYNIYLFELKVCNIYGLPPVRMLFIPLFNNIIITYCKLYI